MKIAQRFVALGALALAALSLGLVSPAVSFAEPEAPQAEGEGEAPATPVQLARKAYAANLEARKTASDLRKEARVISSPAAELTKQIKEETDADKKSELEAQLKDIRSLAAAKNAEANKIERAALDAFLAAFKETPRDAWDDEADKDALADGLFLMSDAVQDLARRIELMEDMLAVHAAHQMARTVRTRLLPKALMSSGDMGAALTRITELHKNAIEFEKPMLALLMGDCHAALGDAVAAKKVYQAALESIPEDLAKNDARNSTKRYLSIRAELTGADAPEIDSKTWMGGEAKPLSALKGKVVVIDFWATWCGPCRVAMPGLMKTYAELKDQGVEVLGLTRFYSYGYLPGSTEEFMGTAKASGKQVRDLTEENFTAHVKEFLDVTKLNYPAVVGTSQDFANYKVSGIPTMAIINPEGKIAMVVVGSGNDDLIHTCIKSLLSQNAESESPPSPDQR